jgi:guanosine-3',5'-bis(diphosphate) 3'-pyrophosphohydrolase
VTDAEVLAAAILHDTLEDTETTPEELEAAFGPRVRALVAEVTDDKKLKKAERKRLQIDHADGLSCDAVLIKLGDKIANVIDVTHSPPSMWDVGRRKEYLDWGRRGPSQLPRGQRAALEARFRRSAATGQTQARGGEGHGRKLTTA